MSRHGTLGLLMLVLVGCASGDPPLDELPLRDAMSATPQTIGAMSFEARRDLAIRLHAAELARDPLLLEHQATGPLPVLEHRDTTSPTDGLETRALAGTAGKVLAAKLAAAHATHLVRVTQSADAIAADADTVYVNASYLVAMAAYDQPTSNLANDDPTGTGSGGMTLQPTPYTFCSVAGEDASRERRLFWIVGPLAFVLLRGRAWRRRSKRG